MQRVTAYTVETTTTTTTTATTTATTTPAGKTEMIVKAVRLFRFTCSARSLVATLRRQAIALAQKRPRKTEI